jgi:hypothetical protein
MAIGRLALPQCALDGDGRHGARRDGSTHAAVIAAGLIWLAEHQNEDGGWGDTVCSKSNISTTALCWAAFGIAGADPDFPEVIQKAEAWLELEANHRSHSASPRATEKTARFPCRFS